MRPEFFGAVCFYEQAPPHSRNGSLELAVEADAHFVHVVTDDHEGHAMMDFEEAVWLHEALDRALETARRVRP